MGFLRFLLLISTFNWAGRPLMVGTNTELGAAPLCHLHTLFNQAREQNTAPAMCIIAPFHTDVSFGLHHCPSRPLLHRLVVLARRALDDILVSQLFAPISCSWTDSLERLTKQEVLTNLPP